jgi:hypothetical protein
MKVTRWKIVSAAVLVESIGGLGYIFSVYSNTLKTEFKLSQSELDLLGTLSNIGGNFGVHIGLIADAVGPAPVVLLGGAIGVAGWLPMYFALSPSIGWRCPYSLLCIMSVLQGHQALTTDVAVVPTVARAFPEHRGLALGLVKSFVGLSGSIVTQVYLGLYRPHIVPFILFVSIVVGVCSLVCAMVMKELPEPRPETERSSAAIQRRFVVGYALTGLLAVQLVASALATQIFSELEQPHWRVGLTATTVIIMLAVLVFLFVQRDDQHWQQGEDVSASAGSGSVQEPLLKTLAAPPPSLPPLPQQQQQLREFTMLEAVATLDFWILFVAFLFSSGAGLILINNLGQIVPAIGGQKGDEDTYVSILSVCNCIGRLACGVMVRAAR